MDLMTILHLMNAGQQPQRNPAFGVNTDNVPQDESGKPLGGYYFDENGNPVGDEDKIKAYKKYGGTNSYIPITGLGAAFNPAAASYVTEQNNAPFNAQRAADINTSLGLRRQATLPPELVNAIGDNPKAINTLVGGDYTAPNLERASLASKMIKGGVPAAQALAAGSGAAAENSSNMYNNRIAQEQLRRYNDYGAETGDVLASNALFNAKGEQRRLPLRERLENTQLGTANENAILADELASARLDLAGPEKRTLQNQIYADAMRSGILSPDAFPVGTSIDNGTFTTGTRNPLYVSPMQLKMAGFDYLTGEKTGVSPLGSGPLSSKVGVPQSASSSFDYTRKPISNPAGALPSSGRSVVADMPKATNINNKSIGTHLDKTESNIAGLEKPKLTPYNPDQNLTDKNKQPVEPDILGIPESKIRSAFESAGKGIKSGAKDFGSKFMTEILGVAPEGYHWGFDANGNKVLVKGAL